MVKNKMGLEFGDKVKIADKSYLDIAPALKLDEVFGDLTFRRVEGLDMIYEDDTSKPRNDDGSYPQIPTGEIRGVLVSLKSSVQHETIFFEIIDQFESQIDELGLTLGDKVTLDGVIFTYSTIGGNTRFKIFAKKIKKLGQESKNTSHTNKKGE